MRVGRGVSVSVGVGVREAVAVGVVVERGDVVKDGDGVCVAVDVKVKVGVDVSDGVAVTTTVVIASLCEMGNRRTISGQVACVVQITSQRNENKPIRMPLTTPIVRRNKNFSFSGITSIRLPYSNSIPMFKTVWNREAWLDV